MERTAVGVFERQAIERRMDARANSQRLRQNKMDFAQDKQERANNFGKARRRFRVEWPNNGTNRRQRRAACFQASSAERKPPLGDKTCQTKVPSRATLCKPEESNSGDRHASKARNDSRTE